MKTVPLGECEISLVDRTSRRQSESTAILPVTRIRDVVLGHSEIYTGGRRKVG